LKRRQFFPNNIFSLEGLIFAELNHGLKRQKVEAIVSQKDGWLLAAPKIQTFSSGGAV
jgi:hypothetical protein